jgi:hypothetical protein
MVTAGKVHHDRPMPTNMRRPRHAERGTRASDAELRSQERMGWMVLLGFFAGLAVVIVLASFI